MRRKRQAKTEDANTPSSVCRGEVELLSASDPVERRKKAIGETRFQSSKPIRQKQGVKRQKTMNLRNPTWTKQRRSRAAGNRTSITTNHCRFPSARQQILLPSSRRQHDATKVHPAAISSCWRYREPREMATTVPERTVRRPGQPDRDCAVATRSMSLLGSTGLIRCSLKPLSIALRRVFRLAVRGRAIRTTGSGKPARIGGNLVAGHPRHGDVYENHIKPSTDRLAHALEAIGGGFHPATVVLQQLAQ